jgi:hypothetical protein
MRKHEPGRNGIGAPRQSIGDSVDGTHWCYGHEPAAGQERKGPCHVAQHFLGAHTGSSRNLVARNRAR